MSRGPGQRMVSVLEVLKANTAVDSAWVSAREIADHLYGGPSYLDPGRYESDWVIKQSGHDVRRACRALERRALVRISIGSSEYHGGTVNMRTMVGGNGVSECEGEDCPACYDGHEVYEPADWVTEEDSIWYGRKWHNVRVRRTGLSRVMWVALPSEVWTVGDHRAALIRRREFILTSSLYRTDSDRDPLLAEINAELEAEDSSLSSYSERAFKILVASGRRLTGVVSVPVVDDQMSLF